ncbi:MAG: hypothetical protein GXO32_00220 [Crenarchaeota archaeon]|nr:hypothetical protein [Thermoproteota archaeon]
MGIVMSFKPIYAEQILRGMKDCEIRTYFGPIEPGEEILVYESTPVKAFTGLFSVREVFVGWASEAIEWLRQCCELFDEENWRFVEQHYVGSRRRLVVIAIERGSARRLPRAVPLAEVRRYIPGYRPPISYARDDRVFSLVLELSRGSGLDAL